MYATEKSYEDIVVKTKKPYVSGFLKTPNMVFVCTLLT